MKKEEPSESIEVLGQNELRVKVAELCGLVQGHTLGYTHAQRNLFYKADPQGRYRQVNTPVDDGRRYSQIDFDPLRDLNACHEFEETLDAKQRKEYVRNLNEGYGAGGMDLTDLFLLINASAEQRCRAFVALMEGRSVGDGSKSDTASFKPNDLEKP